MTNPKPAILLLGAGGQLGTELARALPLAGTVTSLSRSQLDIINMEAVRTRVDALQPDIIINAAAYTAVDKAEQDAGQAHRINALAVRNLARCAAGQQALLIHYSTDYVFDGTKEGAYLESDTPNPVSAYGSSKLAGEQAIREEGCAALILRLSWVFGPAGANFVKTLLHLAQTRESLRVVDDQIGQPTPAVLAARATADLIARNYRRGEWPNSATVFHLASRGAVTWHTFACAIVKEARRIGFPIRLDPERIEKITTSQYPLPARRPPNSRLDVSGIEQALGMPMPGWQPYLASMLGQLKENIHA